LALSCTQQITREEANSNKATYFKPTQRHKNYLKNRSHLNLPSNIRGRAMNRFKKTGSLHRNITTSWAVHPNFQQNMIASINGLEGSRALEGVYYRFTDTGRWKHSNASRNHWCFIR
jgi:hypothetical protein